MFFGLARAGGHFVAEAREHVHRCAAHAAGRAGHEHATVAWFHPVLLQPLDRKPRGEAGGAERHGFLHSQTGRQWFKPIAGQSGIFRKPPEVRDTERAADRDHLLPDPEARIAGFGHDAGEIDARHHRIGSHYGTARDAGEAILVVDARIMHADGDVARRQIVQLELPHTGRKPFVVLVDDKGVERLGQVPLPIQCAPVTRV